MRNYVHIEQFCIHAKVWLHSYFLFSFTVAWPVMHRGGPLLYLDCTGWAMGAMASPGGRSCLLIMYDIDSTDLY